MLERHSENVRTTHHHQAASAGALVLAKEEDEDEGEDVGGEPRKSASAIDRSRVLAPARVIRGRKPKAGCQ